MSSPIWSVTIGIKASSKWWPEGASHDRHCRDQRGRWPLRGVECYGLDQLQSMELVLHRLYWQLMRGL